MGLPNLEKTQDRQKGDVGDGEIKTKICPRCGRELPATSEYFRRDKSKKWGLSSHCKECRHQYEKAYRAQKGREYYCQYYQLHRERYRKYRETHREERREYDRKYYQAHLEERREYNRQYWRTHRKENKGNMREYNRKYYQAHSREVQEHRHGLRKRRQIKLYAILGNQCADCKERFDPNQIYPSRYWWVNHPDARLKAQDKKDGIRDWESIYRAINRGERSPDQYELLCVKCHLKRHGYQMIPTAPGHKRISSPELIVPGNLGGLRPYRV